MEVAKMDIEGSRVRIKTQRREMCEICKIKVETCFMDSPYTMSYVLMGQIVGEDKWVQLGHYFRANEDKLFCHLRNIRLMMEAYLMCGYVSEYDVRIFEQD